MGTGWNGVSLLAGVVVTFACSLHQKFESGDHLILVGEVHDIQRHQGSPLVWCDRGYHCLPAVGRASVPRVPVRSYNAQMPGTTC